MDYVVKNKKYLMCPVALLFFAAGFLTQLELNRWDVNTKRVITGLVGSSRSLEMQRATQPLSSFHNLDTRSSEKPLMSRMAEANQTLLEVACRDLRHIATEIDVGYSSNHPLIIIAGEGTTGTKALAKALTHFDLVVGHNLRTFCPHRCSQHVEAKWLKVVGQMSTNTLATAKNVDFRLFEEFDAISDQPVGAFLPALLKAFPKAKILLNTRELREWSRRRIASHPSGAVPLLTALVPYADISDHMNNGIYGKKNNRVKGSNAFKLHKVGPIASSFLLGIQNMLSACLARDRPLLFLNLWAYRCNSTRLWSDLTPFIGQNRKPQGRFPGCDGYKIT
eukprot:gb/GECG01014790.1/.p1 GENE.gb/GECG01014790.1/~~gb/GECG01014790.1/.p1  ORF type:complete len:336 (+),score=19.75 gb/GECG01014790.1/:1-1008(+)